MLLCSRHLPGQTLRVPTDSQVETVLPSVISGTLRMRTFFFKITPVEQLVKHEESVSFGYKNNDKPVETTYGRTVFNTGTLGNNLVKNYYENLGKNLGKIYYRNLGKNLGKIYYGNLGKNLSKIYYRKILAKIVVVNLGKNYHA